MHDPTKIPLGATQSSDKSATCELADPATFLAGLAVKRPSAGGLSLSSGELIGVSLGKDLADAKKTSVCRSGLRVPLRLTDEGTKAFLVENDLTFTAKEYGGEDISIEFLDTGTAGSEVVTVTDRKISVSMEDGVSTATQIKAKLDAKAEAVALITTTISGTAGDAQAAFAEDNLAGEVDAFHYVEVGAAVEVGSSSGKAVESGDATGATYISAPMKGIEMDGSEVDVALIDMPGGL